MFQIPGGDWHPGRGLLTILMLLGKDILATQFHDTPPPPDTQNSPVELSSSKFILELDTGRSIHSGLHG